MNPSTANLRAFVMHDNSARSDTDFVVAAFNMTTDAFAFFRADADSGMSVYVIVEGERVPTSVRTFSEYMKWRDGARAAAIYQAAA